MKKEVRSVWNENIWERVFPETVASFVKLDGTEHTVKDVLYMFDDILGTHRDNIEDLYTKKFDKVPDGNNAFLVNNKINPVYIPDTILGQLKYGGVIMLDGMGDYIVHSPFDFLNGQNLIDLINNSLDTINLAGYFLVYDGPVLENSAFPYVGNTTLVTGDWILFNKLQSINDDIKMYELLKIDNTDAVTGVKGAKETSYRLGNVSLSAADVGALGEIKIGTVTSGTSASVTAATSGTTSTLNFVLPKGDTGPQGPQGLPGKDASAASFYDVGVTDYKTTNLESDDARTMSLGNNLSFVSHCIRFGSGFTVLFVDFHGPYTTMAELYTGLAGHFVPCSGAVVNDGKLLIARYAYMTTSSTGEPYRLNIRCTRVSIT